MENLLLFVPILLFPLVWVFTVWLITLLGWSRLARRYALRGSFHGHVRSFQSGIIGGFSRYNGVLVIGWGEQGLFLHVFFLFRINHPPLLIPWDEIQEAISDTYWFTKRLRLRMRAPDAPMVTLFGAVTERALDAYMQETGR